MSRPAVQKIHSLLRETSHGFLRFFSRLANRRNEVSRLWRAAETGLLRLNNDRSWLIMFWFVSHSDGIKRFVSTEASMDPRCPPSPQSAGSVFVRCWHLSVVTFLTVTSHDLFFFWDSEHNTQNFSIKTRTPKVQDTPPHDYHIIIMYKNIKLFALLKDCFICKNVENIENHS